MNPDFNCATAKCDSYTGQPLGIPTVKELISILSKLPEDFKVFMLSISYFLCIVVVLTPQKYLIT
jgi:hypothetical protein